jgi:hypothetical protein
MKTSWTGLSLIFACLTLSALSPRDCRAGEDFFSDHSVELSVKGGLHTSPGSAYFRRNFPRFDSGALWGPSAEAELDYLVTPSVIIGNSVGVNYGSTRFGDAGVDRRLTFFVPYYILTGKYRWNTVFGSTKAFTDVGAGVGVYHFKNDISPQGGVSPDVAFRKSSFNAIGEHVMIEFGFPFSKNLAFLMEFRYSMVMVNKVNIPGDSLNLGGDNWFVGLVWIP